MKRLFLYLLMIVALGACIQSEPLNSEADIIACRILNGKGEVEKNIKGNIIINNTQILAQANRKIDLTKLALEVQLTEGATIFPDPSENRDYSETQQFTVTSEDGNWPKTYSVIIDTADLPVKYGFENWELNDKGNYHVIYEKISRFLPATEKEVVFKQYVWASGNSGYLLTGVATDPLSYPTVSVDGGIDGGKAVKLETKSTGNFGEQVKMPIAAGNLFLGSFDVANAVSRPLEATRFGLPFGRRPVTFKGHYKYKPGTGDFKAKDQNGKTVTIPGRMDEGDIYAVLYKSQGLHKEVLNGNNVLTSGNIIAMARVQVVPTDHFVSFEIPFQYDNAHSVQWPDFIYRDASEDNTTGRYLTFNGEEMNDYKYNLAVVFTSSKYGAYFAGSVGSTLYVDQVEVVCE